MISQAFNIDNSPARPQLAQLLLFLFCLGLSLSAALPVRADNVVSVEAPATLEFIGYQPEYEGRIIDSLFVANNNVYDTERPDRSSFIFRTANRLHAITRTRVVRRELLLKVGEPFNLALAEETTRNLRNNFELYDAKFIIRELPNGHLTVSLETTDQWSTFFQLKFRKESDKTGYELKLEERNLAGYNQLVSLDYIAPGDDDPYFKALFRDRRFIGLPYQVTFGYSDNPLSIVRQGSVLRPWYNLDQRWSYGLAVANIKGRRDRYEDSLLVAQSKRRGDSFSAFGEYRWGSYARKIGLNLSYKYLFEKSFDKTILDSAHLFTGFAEDSTYHYFQVRTSFQDLDFLRLNRINGLGYPEDFILGRTYSISVGRASNSEFNNYYFDLLSTTFQEAHQLKENMGILRINRTLWLKDGDNLQNLTDISFKWYNYNLSFMTSAVKLQYRKLWRRDGQNLLTLGGLNGLRGYDQYYLSGYRTAIVNLETRFFSGVDIMSVLFGGVLFYDAGKIWSDDGLLDSADWKHSVGVGLRISMEQSSKSQIVRLDLARTDDREWQLLIGTGQYF